MDPLQWMGAVRMRFQTADKSQVKSLLQPVDFDVRRQQGTYFTGGSVIVDYGLLFYPEAMV